MERTGLPQGPKFYSNSKALINNAEPGDDENREILLLKRTQR